jgi:hypothetical protein
VCKPFATATQIGHVRLFTTTDGMHHGGTKKEHATAT